MSSNPRLFMGLWLWMAGMALHWHTQVWLLFLVESLLLYWGVWKPQSTMPKWVSWLSVPIFSIWFVSLPTGLVWGYMALATFFHWLAILQWMGGQNRFVWVNGALTLGFLFHWWNVFAAFLAFLWLLLIWKHSKKGKGYQSLGIQVVFAFCLTLFLWWSSSWIPSMGGRSWSADQTMGFSANSILGSFRDAYQGEKQSQVVLRVYTPQKLEYLQGLVYQRYQSGIWRRSDSATWVEYPQKRLGEYALFGTNSENQYPPVWVHVSKSSDGFVFLDRGTSRLAMDVDSLIFGKWGVVQAAQSLRDRGYYMDFGVVKGYPISSEDYQLPQNLQKFMDSVSLLFHLDTVSAKNFPSKLSSLFRSQFRYSLQVDLNKGEDPLRSFVRNREGYCEYFASLAVLLLRSKGIPARYMTGFAFPDSIGNAWVYRERNAHAWLEYNMDNEWKLLDVTPPNYRPKQEMGRLQRSMEQFTSWVHRVKHLLLDGLWRESLENWSSWIRNHKTQIVLGMFLPLSLIGGLIWYRKTSRKRLASRKEDIVSLLLEAENRLNRKGHYRPKSLPVGLWIQSLPLDVDAKSLQFLQEYQKKRFSKK